MESELIFGKYEIIKRLAVGGMGEVFLARQTGIAGFDRLVILKSLLPELAEREDFVEQFLDEARVAATLNHPNIVAIYEVGSWNGVYFIAMEHIHGEDLFRVARAMERSGARMPFPIAARVVHDAALGLAHAHHATDVSGRPLHIVHRDVSPQNIMVRGDGVTKVVDFGIAKSANRASRTATGLVKGKMSYMPPEQVAGAQLDGRSDQFSLGVVLWELCTGERLFQGTSEINTLEKVLRQPIVGPSALRPEVPAALDAVVLRMLSRDRDLRYPDCADVAADLGKYLDGCSSAGDHKAVAEVIRGVLGEEIDAKTRDIALPQRDNFLISFGGASGGSEVQVTPTGATMGTGGPAPPRSMTAVAASIGIAMAAALFFGGALLLREPGGSPEGAAPAPLAPAPAAVAVEVEVEPPRALTAALLLKSEPAQSSVWLEGDLVGTTPLELKDLPADTARHLRLTLEGHRPAELTITLAAGKTESRSIKLEPVRRGPRPAKPRVTATPAPQEQAAYLTIATTPWAKISVDGQPYGSTPVFKVAVKPGERTVHLQNEQLGVDVKKVIVVKPGETLKRSWDLKQER